MVEHASSVSGVRECQLSLLFSPGSETALPTVTALFPLTELKLTGCWQYKQNTSQIQQAAARYPPIPKSKISC